MSYKARRKKEVQAREEKTEHLMSTPAPVLVLGPGDVPPQWVPLRLNERTVREIRVSKLEANLERYALEFGISVDELVRTIAARRYVPAPAAKAVQPRNPGWYLSDLYR